MKSAAPPKIIGLVAIILTLITFAGVALSICLRYPDNHTANPLALKLMSILALATGLGIIYWQRRFAVILLLLALCGLLSDYALDRANILISYEEWINRGMPAWGTRS